MFHLCCADQNSKINFACSREDILRNINPLGKKNFPSVFEPGLIEAMIDLKSQRNPEYFSTQTEFFLGSMGNIS
jgi:hypothetical protein